MVVYGLSAGIYESPFVILPHMINSISRSPTKSTQFALKRSHILLLFTKIEKLLIFFADMFRSNVIELLRSIDFYYATGKWQPFATSPVRQDLESGYASSSFVIDIKMEGLLHSEIKFTSKSHEEILNYL